MVVCCCGGVHKTDWERVTGAINMMLKFRLTGRALQYVLVRGRQR
jgi:hypothetical protein